MTAGGKLPADKMITSAVSFHNNPAIFRFGIIYSFYDFQFFSPLSNLVHAAGWQINGRGAVGGGR